MPSRSLFDCHLDLAAAWRLIESRYHAAHPGRHLIITCTYRSPAEQAELYTQGRSRPGPIVTQLDGVHKMSKHNESPARALDFAVTIGGKVTWDTDAYADVGILAREAGLVWGGDWKTFRDMPHVELPGPLTVRSA